MNKETLKNVCEELLTADIGETCKITITVANKLKIEVGEDFYIFDDKWKVRYVKFRGWYGEVGNTIRLLRKCFTANEKRFLMLLSD